MTTNDALKIASYGIALGFLFGTFITSVPTPPPGFAQAFLFSAFFVPSLVFSLWLHL